jgi:lysozyme
MAKDSDILISLLLVGGIVALVFMVPRMTQTMRTSQQGRADIIRHEGIRYDPYKDVAGYWTVGIGHLIVPGDGVARDANGIPQPIDETLLMTLFETDLSHAEKAVNDSVYVPLTQNQFDALVDFVFNFGASRFSTSTLRRLLNEGSYPAAAAEFKKWIHAGGVPVPGLIARRNDNYNTFIA